MPRPLQDFIRALRSADVRVSVAEAMEAHNVLANIGFENRSLLKDGLALTLAKSQAEKQAFDVCFDTFFARSHIIDEPRLRTEEPTGETMNRLAGMLLAGDETGLAMTIESAAARAGTGNIRFATQINFMSRRLLDEAGLGELEELISETARGDAPGGQQLAQRLEDGRTQLITAARDYVEQQFQVFARDSAGRLREQFLEQTPLGAIDRRDIPRMKALIRRLARKLATRHAQRRNRDRRGQLDVRRTIRANVAHDGIPFQTKWRRRRIDRPKIVAVCDVSRSVAASANFLLMFLHSLSDIVSELRSFAFSSEFVEVADILDHDDVETAIERILNEIGFMPTNYGRALHDLQANHADVIDRHTTLLILGDARSNNLNPRSDVMKRLNQRAKRIIWLNPEPESFWGIGDSEMLRYRPYCHVAKTCRTIKDLERAIDSILTPGTRAS